jgi:hypothetical protein
MTARRCHFASSNATLRNFQRNSTKGLGRRWIFTRGHFSTGQQLFVTFTLPRPSSQAQIVIRLLAHVGFWVFVPIRLVGRAQRVHSRPTSQPEAQTPHHAHVQRTVARDGLARCWQCGYSRVDGATGIISQPALLILGLIGLRVRQESFGQFFSETWLINKFREFIDECRDSVPFDA